jgi:plastocyanin
MTPRTISTTRLPVLAVGAVAALAIAGCGGGSSSSSSSGSGSGGAAASTSTTTSASSGGGTTVKMDASEYKFAPATVKAKAGTVTFALKNTGQFPHGIEIQGGSASQIISGGQSTTFKTSLKPGSYTFFCPVPGHREKGMVGKITVS